VTLVNDKPAVKRVQINVIHTHVSSSETRNVDAATTANNTTVGYTATSYSGYNTLYILFIINDKQQQLEIAYICQSQIVEICRILQCRVHQIVVVNEALFLVNCKQRVSK